MSRGQTLDERYFTWLCQQVKISSRRDPSQSHILVAEQMYKIAFDDSVPNDFNRSLDGKDLRTEFLDLKGIVADQDWLDLDCSILEMLIGLSRRVSDKIDWTVSAAFWLIVENIELKKYTDEKYNDGIARAVDYVLNTINDRSYDANGQGGLFPLRDPRNDQREVEIWYQMSAYLMENFEF